MHGRGFHWFVAMRYLRGSAYTFRKRDPDKPHDWAEDLIWWVLVPFVMLIKKGSKALLLLTGASLAFTAAALVMRYLVLDAPTPGSYLPVDPWIQRSELGAIIGGALAVIFGTLTVLRRVFSFFSTVSIAGVWIGTMALVFVLSVMSGFENDLRGKILGSNAHIQVSREEGDFVEWEDVMKRVQKIPGVIASTPFAVSEVVIAANNNYFNVIIKGIDPEQIGTVTDLKDDLLCDDRKCTRKEAEQVMARLNPLVVDETPREVPQRPDTPSSGGVDPAPPDMVDGTNPIDYSGGDEADEAEEAEEREESGTGTGAGTGSAGSGAGTGDRMEPDPEKLPFGGEAAKVLELDAAPSQARVDHDAGAIDPEELDEDDDGRTTRINPDGTVTHTISLSPVDIEPLSQRTRSLPGVLVGKELKKQIHLYPDQEVRLVSPLSDPANPDATGTPIPFNRDYRVAGVFFTGMYEYDLKFVYVTLDSLQDFLDRGDVVDGLEVRIADADETPTVVAAIQRSLGPKYRVQDWRELNRSLFSALKLEKIAMFLVLAIIILVASFSIVGNLVMVVVEKGKEIALLKTLGASDTGVTWIFMTQGFFIGLFGTVLGVTYGLIGCALAKAYGIPINPDVYYIDELPIHIDLPSIGLIAAAGLLISVGATLYPALMASRLRPSVGLRH